MSDKKEKPCRWIACVAVYDEREELTTYPITCLFKSIADAEAAVYESIVREYTSGRDQREFGEFYQQKHIGKSELDVMLGWLTDKKKLYVTYTIEELDD